MDTKIDPTLAIEWIAALRSGEYKPVSGCLIAASYASVSTPTDQPTGYCYCAEGVLAELLQQKGHLVYGDDAGRHVGFEPLDDSENFSRAYIPLPVLRDHVARTGLPIGDRCVVIPLGEVGPSLQDRVKLARPVFADSELRSMKVSVPVLSDTLFEEGLRQEGFDLIADLLEAVLDNRGLLPTSGS